jgi:hypothetical protein
MDLVAVLDFLRTELAELRTEIVALRKQRDELKRELERQYHAWTRDDLEDVVGPVTDAEWKDWCISWEDIYNLEYEQEAMRIAFDDWRASRRGE